MPLDHAGGWVYYVLFYTKPACILNDMGVAIFSMIITSDAVPKKLMHAGRG